LHIIVGTKVEVQIICSVVYLLVKPEFQDGAGEIHERGIIKIKYVRPIPNSGFEQGTVPRESIDARARNIIKRSQSFGFRSPATSNVSAARPVHQIGLTVPSFILASNNISSKIAILNIIEHMGR